MNIVSFNQEFAMAYKPTLTINNPWSVIPVHGSSTEILPWLSVKAAPFMPSNCFGQSPSDKNIFAFSVRF